ncbi:MAG: thioredoxin domain-containing protein [Anaerolineae bacterium]
MSKRPNRLIDETSPYLLQHAYNPVDWFPWGEEALQKARAEDKPIFLSIGYSACHWCHVMEHESFEDEETARLMNRLYVNIKVDREERPDLDSIYMEAVQAMTGHGGWPMSVFLTPDGFPFYGGTYFPPTPRHGMPSFRQVLAGVEQAYRDQRDRIEAQQARGVQRQTLPLSRSDLLDPAVPELALPALNQQFDRTHGGFGGAPKFPQPMTLDFLLRAYHRNQRPELLQMAELTLTRMARGGIYDHVGGGFHRYSVDERWLAPHFEKMLYDNALLARLYLHAYQLTCRPRYRQVVEETLDYVAREMTHPNGGFYSTQDADSEGEEGKFYLWTVEEVRQVLGDAEGEIFCGFYDVAPGGNFEGKSILNIPREPEQFAQELGLDLPELQAQLGRNRQALYAVREERVKPGLDDKVLTAWNGLMLAAFAEAARVLKRDDYRQIAERNAAFVLRELRQDGRLWRTWKDGRAKLMAYLEDYAFYSDGLLALYQTTFDPGHFAAARDLAETILAHFHDPENGGFFDTADDHEQLIIRPKNLQDNATPSGNAMAVRVLLALAAYSGDDRYYTPAAEALGSIQGPLSQYPIAFAHWLGALEFATAPPREVAIIGEAGSDDTRALVETALLPYRPNQVVALAPPDDAQTAQTIPLLAERPQQADRATAYVCHKFTCQAPVTSPEALGAQL